ncbi:ATPase [Pseudomonas fakonensis]|uniref:ATPase n=1 Tax=Pseudomonas fakonensis TaxID=2842355 RepID=A0ABX8NBK0_9PSED|nr:ATPase [Pseudomonas fakonensis]QXH53754.1 ATPase [Pseudomonas fakonensis]
MKTGMIAALLALLAALTGCASPQANQPGNHLYSATELSSVSLSHGQHVAVLLGRNAAATLDYLQRHHDQAAPASGQATPVATLGGNQAYAWLANSLAQQFAEVTFYEDLDTLLADRPDVIVLLDAQSKLASSGSEDIQASVVARFFDEQLTYIGRAEGLSRKGAKGTDLVRQLQDEQSVQADALRQFDASLKVLLQGAV